MQNLYSNFCNKIRALKLVNKRDFLKFINLYYSEEKQRYQVFIPGMDSNGFNKESLSKAILTNKQDDIQIQKLFGWKDPFPTTGSQYFEADLNEKNMRPNDYHCTA